MGDFILTYTASISSGGQMMLGYSSNIASGSYFGISGVYVDGVVSISIDLGTPTVLESGVTGLIRPAVILYNANHSVSAAEIQQ